MKNVLYYTVGSIILLVTCVSLVYISFNNTGKQLSPSDMGKQLSPSDIVNDYFTISLKNNFEDLDYITVQDKSFDKELKSRDITKDNYVNEGNTLQVHPRDKNYASDLPNYRSEVFLNWIRSDFPRLILNSKLKVESIEEEIIIEDKAKVTINVYNDIIKSSKWVFMLKRHESEWKIFDITTVNNSKTFPNYP